MIFGVNIENWMVALVIFAIGIPVGVGKCIQIISQHGHEINSLKADIKEIRGKVNDINDIKNYHSNLIQTQMAQTTAIFNAFGSLFVSMQNIVPTEDLINIQAKLSMGAVNNTLDAIKGGTGNPINAEEAERIQEYINKTRKNQPFTPGEAQDFYKLSEIVVQDRSNDQGAWSILLIAGIILALYYLNKK